VLHRHIDEGQLGAAERDVVERKDLREIRAADAIAPIDQTVRDPAFGLRIGILRDLHDGSDFLVCEGRHLSGRPEPVVGQPIGERRQVIKGHPLVRLERPGIEATDRRQARVLRAHPGRGIYAETGDVAQRSILSVHRIPALPHRLRAGNAAAQCRREVEQIVADVRRLSLRLDHNVNRMERIHARVVQPGGKDLQAPQVPPVLVRHDVVRVVAAGAEQLIRTDQRHAVGRNPEGYRAIAVVAPAGDIGQQTIDLLGKELAYACIGRDVARVRGDNELFAIEGDQVRFRNVIAKRVKEARRDHLGAGR
jgi:hypothetical protein